ncbi:nucleotide-binding universal stress UspA family protein [Actinoplanes campanulatus]|uniref:Nucleotide-binding universal stress UspA family protein n=1 Tax=Actinoplanes campanulatus TaxID=113559 RepID=A0A7W5FJX1_9ACTN|nr:universal stress protein [Actinoplanes campanulatus]MBB3101096.1 nucleotide-binding universal stress UspA family protein [Actinoplanes campanulatus]GGN51816.1 hypothetical protein GCM10010109_92270 [Actinoplanes campanulatus]GID42043.1 hypothetical protein Aca09nite_85490 [Actinoplanes campanulatus]
MLTPAVVVGTDGTEHGTAAVRWAALEAGRRRLPLRIVHVLDWDWSVSRYDYQGEHVDAARRSAGSRRPGSRHRNRTPPNASGWSGSWRRGGRSTPTCGWRPWCHTTSAASVLAEVSHGTQLIVVGGHGHGTVLGSTGLQLLHHADCPVLVVRRGTNGRTS